MTDPGAAARAFDKIARGYDATYRRRIDKAEDRVLAGIIAPHAGRSLLDVGCGTGHLLTTLADRGIRPHAYLGIDVSIGMLAVARRNHPGRTFARADIHQDMNGLLPALTYDCAACLFAYPYFSDPIGALKRIRALTRPGGRLILMAYRPAYAHREPCFLPPTWLPFRGDTPESLHSAIRSAGWVVDQIECFRRLPDGLLDRLPVWASTAVLHAERAVCDPDNGLAMIAQAVNEP